MLLRVEGLSEIISLLYLHVCVGLSVGLLVSHTLPELLVVLLCNAGDCIWMMLVLKEL